MQENQPASQPEIDLFYFSRPIIKLLQKLWNGIAHYFRSFWRNRLLALGIVLSFLLIGSLIWYLVPKSYKTESIFVSRIIPSWVCSDLLKDLNSKSIKLNQVLKISQPAAVSILNINSAPLGPFYLSRSYDSLLYYNNGDSAIAGVKIGLNLANLKYLDTIQHALVLYLGNSPYALKRTRARREALLTLRTFLVNKVNSLDSVQQIVNESILPRKEYSTGDPINPVDVYEATVHYSKQIIGIDQELSILDNVEVLYPFTHYSKENYPEPIPILLVALGVGIVLALILAPWFGKKQKLL